jgi:hypothetical protein
MPFYSLRLVAQQVRTPSAGRYRLVAYSSDHEFKHTEFDSLAELQIALQSTLPDFECSPLKSPTTPETQILFASALNLSDQQIRDLGLAIISKS